MHAEVLSSQPASLSPWIHTRPLPAARLRLFCFPFAGGSAGSFMPWFTQLAPHVQLCAIQLPGRGARFGELLLLAVADLHAEPRVPRVGDRA